MHLRIFNPIFVLILVSLATAGGLFFFLFFVAAVIMIRAQPKLYFLAFNILTVFATIFVLKYTLFTLIMMSEEYTHKIYNTYYFFMIGLGPAFFVAFNIPTYII